MLFTRRALLALLTFVLSIALCAGAQAASVEKSGYITMSDGVKLRYTVVLPAESGRFPVAMKYDGYCEGTDPLTCNEGSPGQASAFLAAGYAVIGVSMRGTGCSTGQFDFRNPQEHADGKAVVEWAASQPWSSGRVGMFGDSFPGLMQPGVAALHPKGLAAIAPFQIVDDVYRDVAFPGGVGNGEFGAFWGLGDQPAASYSGQVSGTTRGDTQCVQSSAEQLVTNPTTNIFVAGYQHQYIDSFWNSKTIGADASKIDVPAFGCATWQDDEVGSRSTWTLWPRLDPERTWLLTANGYHAECVYSAAINAQLLRFFDRFVKGEHNGFESTPHVQLWHETTGASDAKPTWITTSSSWPPATKTKKLYLRSGGALSAARPAASEAADTYVSPTVSAGTEDGIVFGQQNRLWKVPGTPSGAVAYTTPKLDRALELLGPLSVNLWLSSTALDTGLQATITEVRPDGQEVYVQRGWLTASQRKLDKKASTPTMPVLTNLEADVQQLPLAQPTFVRLPIMPVDHVFRAGSRLRLVIDTPSQTGGWNWQPVKGAGVNSILHDAAHQSELVFGAVRGAKAPEAYPACDTLLNQPCRPDAFAQ